jgi:hypothetical protein
MHWMISSRSLSASVSVTRNGPLTCGLRIYSAFRAAASFDTKLSQRSVRFGNCTVGVSLPILSGTAIMLRGSNPCPRQKR